VEKEREFNFESKVTLEKLLLHIESSSLFPLSLNTLFKLKGQRDADSILINNFSRVTLLSKLNCLSFSTTRNWIIYRLQNETEGSSQKVYSIWKAKDKRYPIVTWKPNI
jgi:hypothetical protein